MQYQYSKNKGTTQGSNEAATSQNTFDYETEYGTNPAGHPAYVQRLAGVSDSGRGHLAGRLARWRHPERAQRCAHQRDDQPRRQRDGQRQTVTNIPGGNSRGTQRPDVVPGVDPYLKDGVRWLNPAAFTTPQPGTFGNLARNALRGPEFVQLDMMFSKDFQFAQSQSFQLRVELFNLTNRLNYENPAASLPGNGTAGVPFTDAQAGTFGYMLGPLNRTVGLGTARQTQISLRYSF